MASPRLSGMILAHCLALAVGHMVGSRPSRSLRVIVPGAVNTDIAVIGVPNLPGAGEDVYGLDLRIGPGGKARNIAHMIAVLTGRDTVAILSRTSKDPFGLWKLPIDALKSAGVNTHYVFLEDYAHSGLFPGIALVAVDAAGNRNASVLNTVLDDFSVAEIDRARPLFEAVACNKGLLVLTLELPVEVAVHAVKLATSLGIRVLLDPGGLRYDADINNILDQQIYLLKPNEHEAKLLSGVDVTDSESARCAAAKLMERGIHNVLITHGANGGYFFSQEISQHIPAPQIGVVGQTDATGCGDQVMAALCAYLNDAFPLPTAAMMGILAGTLQFQRIGVQPVRQHDIRAEWTRRAGAAQSLLAADAYQEGGRRDRHH